MDIEYEEPQTEWVHEAAHETLIVYVPEYKKDELKVQLTNLGELRVRGERQVGENKVSRFSLKFPTPANCDVNGILANIKGRMLYVKFPKLTAPLEPEPQQDKPKLVPSKETPRPDQEATQGDQEQPTQKSSPHKDKDKQTSTRVTVIEPQKQEDVPKKQKDQEQVADKEVSPKTTTEKPRIEKTGDGVAKTNDVSSKAKDEVKEVSDRNGKTRDEIRGKDQGVIGGLVMEIRNRRRVMNPVLAVLLVVVLGLYVRNAFMSMFGESDDLED